MHLMSLQQNIREGDPPVHLAEILKNTPKSVIQTLSFMLVFMLVFMVIFMLTYQ